MKTTLMHQKNIWLTETAKEAVTKKVITNKEYKEFLSLAKSVTPEVALNLDIRLLKKISLANKLVYLKQSIQFKRRGRALAGFRSPYLPVYG